ncbi:LuxR family transcriptional regulator [Mucilaginibacter limnophilus]|uniref:LuxR family transcriptional regulator n=1 Tax=Mucilaginibacter limnophilus TaxID=1932778 RepID=A0A3S2V605_9SPHI|nr:helix-turn-helix transcriptional regulator [Mucilaginibacter limnophilus]RVT97310.1 LuxR family transcriptional regulator [Mucilaginibacter limnophilus]
MQKHQLPAGLLNSDVELFACEQGLEAYQIKNGNTVPFEKFDEPFLVVVERHMMSFPIKLAALDALGIFNRLDRIKKFLICNYGGFDRKPDVIDGLLQATEYWPCPHRGNCSQEGKLCDALQTDNGQYLTRREIEYVQLTAKGLLDKQIAGIMQVELVTVTTYSRNVRTKTGLARKADITRFAHQKFLIW